MPTPTRDDGPTHRLWALVDASVDAPAAVAAVLGLPLGSARQLVGLMLATSDEAEDLLDRMPVTLRSLAISTTVRTQRSHGEIRGPVLWSETTAARAATAGDPGLFICMAPEKAYDTLPNQVLVAAIGAVVDAGHAGARASHDDYDDEVVHRARHNLNRALRALDHRALIGVTRRRPDGRALRRTRAGSRRRIYQPALSLLARAADPLTPGQLRLYVDERTSAQHQLVVDLVAALRGREVYVRRLRASHGALVGGPLTYLHPRLRGTAAHLHGVLLGDILVDVPDDLSADPGDRPRVEAALAGRSGGRPVVAILEAGDVDRAIDGAGYGRTSK